jgi:hypothetical protein
MGDNFLKQQARNFKKGRDLAAAELGEPSLFERDEILQTVYTAVPSENCTLVAGETLTVVASDDGQTADLARGHQRVGRVEGDAARSLLRVLTQNESAGIARVFITEVSGISGAAAAVVNKDG